MSGHGSSDRRSRERDYTPPDGTVAAAPVQYAAYAYAPQTQQPAATYPMYAPAPPPQDWLVQQLNQAVNSLSQRVAVLEHHERERQAARERNYSRNRDRNGGGGDRRDYGRDRPPRDVRDGFGPSRDQYRPHNNSDKYYGTSGSGSNAPDQMSSSSSPRSLLAAAATLPIADGKQPRTSQ